MDDRNDGLRLSDGTQLQRRDRPLHLVLVGLSCCDHIWQVAQYPPRLSRTPATSYRMQGGGPAATAAVTAARLGAKAELWAIHGDDANGRAAKGELERFGVDTSQLRVVPGAATWVSAVLVAPDGERFIFPFAGSGLSDTADTLDAERLTSVDCVLVDGRHPKMCGWAAAEARRRGIPTVGDFGDARSFDLAVEVDYLIASEECAGQVSGQSDPEAALSALRRFEGQFVGITLGEQGFLYDDGRRVRHLPALSVDVVDTTGAGDVFHGAFAFAVARGDPPSRCALFASVAAALSCQGLGRTTIPALAAVEHLLEMRTLKEMNELRWTS